MRWAAVAMVTVLVGCGGGGSAPPVSGGTACMARTACGGVVVGTWTITSQCVDVSLVDVCAGAKLDPAGLTTTGAVTYNSDLSYVLTWQTKGMQKLTIPKACLGSGGMTSSCAEFGSSITDSLYSGVTGTLCSSLSGACDCSVDVDTQQMTESGTYLTSGFVVTHTPTNGTPYDSNFCVNGTELDETSMRANVTGVTAFTRQ
jgi:hypothetical protein